MREFALGLAFAVALGLSGQEASAASQYKLLQFESHFVKWGNPHLGTAATVSYALVPQSMSFPGARNCGALRPLDRLLSASKIPASVFQSELRAAFAEWEVAANIRFRDAKDPTAADILIGAQDAPRGWAFTNVDYADASDGRTRTISKALICLNPERPWKIGFDGNIDIYDLRYTLLHEIGHAIGLDHPGPKGELMSFKYRETFRSLQAGDAAGAGVLYGTTSPSVIAETPEKADMEAAHSQRVSGSQPQLSLGDDKPSEAPRPAGLK
ncbi:MAG: matrixin family metalloprotease [Hyphomicrobiales bacterium]|nr:matrixin family metalloprotease [Hyphomicrobiales bacterium]